VDAVVQWLFKLLLSPPPASAAAGVSDVVTPAVAAVGDAAAATVGAAGEVVLASFFRLVGVFRGVPPALPRLAPRDVEEVEEAGEMERSSLVRGLRPRLLFREWLLRLDATQSSS